MNIKTIVVGMLQTNCYIVERGNTCIIIDPGDEADKILSNIESNKKVLGIFVTHSHDDHVGAVADLMTSLKCPMYSFSNLSEGVNTFENFKFKVIRFPGHKEDCVAFYFEDDKTMFVGDFIFKGSIGRYDLEGASSHDMKQSIAKVLNYDKDIILYPGHGPKTVLSDEINTLNYFMNII